MPKAFDPEIMKIVQSRVLNKLVCRKCGALNPPSATRCRRCRSRNLRPKRMLVGMKKS